MRIDFFKKTKQNRVVWPHDQSDTAGSRVRECIITLVERFDGPSRSNVPWKHQYLLSSVRLAALCH